MVAPAKAALRREILAARRSVDAATRAQEAARLAELLVDVAGTGGVTCAYVPMGTEPGSMAMLDGLRAAGVRVLLPLARQDGELDWAEFTGTRALAPGGFGMLEPTNAPLGPDAIATAGSVVVPALAVDRRGTRLGRGAGFYDRALRRVRDGVPVLAVVRAAEVYEVLPRQDHDVAVGSALTPAGLIELASAL